MAVTSARLVLCAILLGFFILCFAQVHGLPPGYSPHGNSTLPVEDTGQEPDAPPQAEQTADAGALALGKPEGNTSGSEGEQPEGACGGCDDEGVTPLDPPWLRQGRDWQGQYNQAVAQSHANVEQQLNALPAEDEPEGVLDSHTTESTAIFSNGSAAESGLGDSLASDQRNLSAAGVDRNQWDTQKPLSSGTGEEVPEDGAGTDHIPVSPVVLQSSGTAVLESEAETNIPVGASAAVSLQVTSQHRPGHHQPHYASALGLHVRGNNVWVTPDTNDSDDDSGSGHDLGDNIHMRPEYQLHNPNLTDTNLDDIDLARQRARRAGQSGSLLVLVFTCVVLVLNGRPVRGRAAVRGPLLQHSHNGHHIELPPSWLLVSFILAVILFMNLVMQS